MDLGLPAAAALVTVVALMGACSGEPEPRARRIASQRVPPAAAPSTAPPMAQSTVTPAVPAALAVRLHEYAIDPPNLAAPAGTVTVVAHNDDNVPHDVTLLRTALSAQTLPTVGIRVDESDPALELIARTPRLGPGQTETLTASLAAGTYVLVCTVPHHYVREAMVGRLTVGD